MRNQTHAQDEAWREDRGPDLPLGGIKSQGRDAERATRKTIRSVKRIA